MDEVVLTARGRVQGVFFRATVRGWAEDLGVTGVAQNLPDGSVRIVAQGQRRALEELHRRCQAGPPAAAVASCTAVWRAADKRYTDFNIQ